MNEFNIKSKVYVVPKKKTLFWNIFINICIIITVAFSLLSLITNGVKLSNVSTIIIAFIISTRIKVWLKTKPYYEFTTAKIMITNDSIIINYDFEQQIYLSVPSLISVEYSDQLECVRFVSDYIICEGEQRTECKCAEYLLYVSSIEYPLLLETIEQTVDKKIVYIDRNSAKT